MGLICIANARTKRLANHTLRFEAIFCLGNQCECLLREAQNGFAFRLERDKNCEVSDQTVFWLRRVTSQKHASLFFANQV